MTDRGHLVPHDAIATLGAGGIVALGAKLAEDQRASAVTARAYPHPALEPGKVIIRLEPDAVAAGTDAEMAAFGFGEPEVSKPLGQVRFRTLGFPAWALVNEPKKAKAALEVTDEMRKAKRLVQAKPGHAKDAFEKIAKTLSRGTPQFLPSFWEEVGRVVADQASSTMAAQCFERARQAERAYKLKTNPEDTDAVFVEFALLGALSAKTLSQYAKDLAKTAGGKEAYRRFRAIIIKRALGGMPPYSGMGKDLQALAKGAGLDVDKEADALALEMLEAPGINKAPSEFWSTYRDALVRIGREKPEARARLRNLWPSPKGGNQDAKKTFQSETWMTVLDEIGALSGLPDEGLGAWMSRLFAYAGKTERTEALLREVAPRLVALRQPIKVETPRPRWGSDLNLDLAELALQLGVPLDEDVSNDRFYPESMTVDPVLVAGHAVYGKRLAAAVADMMGEAEHEPRMRGKQGFVAARRMWIEEQLDKLGGASLSTIAETLVELDHKTTPETFLPFADLQERLAKADLAESLVLHLRSGIVDELGWPLYEETVKKLGDGPIMTGGAFPVLTVWSMSKVFAIDHTGVRAEHDIVAKPTEYKIERAFLFGDALFVELDPEKGWQNMFYWASAPKELHEQKAHLRTWGGNTPYAWTLPDGSVTLGHKAFHPGGSEITGTMEYLCDGTTMWQKEYGRKLRAYDPIKNTKGAEDGGPAWIAQWTKEGYETDVRDCRLHPAPPGLTFSPLGIANGLLGVRVRNVKGERADDDPRPFQEAERVDGRMYTGFDTPRYLVSFPGDESLRVVTTEQASSKRFIEGGGPGAQLHDPSGKHDLGEINQHPWTSRGWGTVPVPPVAFWHYLTPRDEASSRALRGITTDVARTILEAAIKEVSARPDGGTITVAIEAAIKSALPGVTHPAIVAGIAGHAERAAELVLQAREMASARHKDNADASGTALVGEAGNVRKMALALATGKATKIADFDTDIEDWLVRPRAEVMRALSPVSEEAARRKAREIAQALAGTILADDLSSVRYLAIEEPDDWTGDDDEEYGTLKVVKHEASVFAIHEDNNWAIEYTTDGTFRAPPNKWKVDKATKLSKGIGTAWAEKLLALPDAPMAWEPAMAERTAKRADLSLAEATLLFHGAPKRNAWGKDFLGKPTRELLGLKRDEASAANETFKPLTDDVLYALLDAAVPDDPALLLAPATDGGWADRVGDAWKKKYGKKTKIPQDLIAQAKKELSLGNDLAEILPLFAGELDLPWLRNDDRPFAEIGGWRKRGEGYLTPRRAKEVATLAAWLFFARPIGCPIRAGVPAAIKKLRAMLSAPEAIWKIDDFYVDDDSAKDKARADALMNLVAGKTFDAGKSGEDLASEARDDGAVLVARYTHHVHAGFRPGKLDGAGGKTAEKLAQAMFDEENTPGGDPLEDLKTAQLILSDGFAALADRVDDTEVPEGGFEANPLASAPKLVAKVAKAEGLSQEAAALYLQVLALAEPTQKNVTTWNGWTTKQYAAASAELVKKKLVVEGKRERAGRSIFIKGGYTKGDRENLPTEEWKLPFYAGLDRNVPHEPTHELFERAYKRAQSDPP
ncbi:MAG: hypothetical protein AB7T06_11350 [Kofleriaceae bacterium]